ncbi:MAG: anti-sigma factor [Candidatus Sulfotelmatobacter sp.]
MNCVELQNSLVEIEDGRSREQRAHLSACRECSTLLAELNLIASAASDLRAANEPSPRVWNSIEIALRQEGLIHPRRAQRPLLSSFSVRWGRAGWLVPLAAALLIAVGIYVRPYSAQSGPSARNDAGKAGQVVAGLNAGLDDQDFLQQVADSAPMMRAQWEDNLRNANDYIRDAQSGVDENPNDAEARRSLLDAYQQKAMLFEMAMDRSLP